MSSTNKTSHLELNQWVGSDVPKRADFNADNSIIDAAIYRHTSDDEVHTTAEEKDLWNQPYVIKAFTGNGNLTRDITVTNAFDPSWGLIFKVNYTPTVVDIDNRTKYNYIGFFSTSGSSSGLTLSSNKLTVTQASVAILGDELRCYNENGSSYIIIAFR